jgi:hypothetical protein
MSPMSMEQISIAHYIDNPLVALRGFGRCRSWTRHQVRRALLQDLLGCGGRMVPGYTTKRNRRYAYYVCRRASARDTVDAARDIFGEKNVRFYGGGVPNVFLDGGQATAAKLEQLLNWSSTSCEHVEVLENRCSPGP